MPKGTGDIITVIETIDSKYLSVPLHIFRSLGLTQQLTDNSGISWGRVYIESSYIDEALVRLRDRGYSKSIKHGKNYRFLYGGSYKPSLVNYKPSDGDIWIVKGRHMEYKGTKGGYPILVDGVGATHKGYKSSPFQDLDHWYNAPALERLQKDLASIGIDRSIETLLEWGLTGYEDHNKIKKEITEHWRN